MKDPFAEIDVNKRNAVSGVALVFVVAAVLATLQPTVLGVIILILAIVAAIVLHEAGHFVTAKLAGMKVTEFFVGFGPRLWSFQRGETEYGVKAIPLGGYVRIIGMNNLEEIDNPQDESRTYRSSTFPRKTMVILAGVTVNFLLAVMLFFTVLVGAGRIVPGQPVVARVDTGTPAARAGLESDDVLVAINGKKVKNGTDVTSFIAPRSGERITLTVRRDNKLVNVPVTPAPTKVKGKTIGRVGVQLGAELAYAPISVKDSVGESFVMFGSATDQTVNSVMKLFSASGVKKYANTVTSEDGATSADRPRTVIGIVNIGSDLLERDVWSVVLLLAILNLFLGLFNLLPLLPFDGGHAAIAVYERIASGVTHRRVRADYRKLLPLSGIVLLVLVTLFATAGYLDIKEIIG